MSRHKRNGSPEVDRAAAEPSEKLASRVADSAGRSKRRRRQQGSGEPEHLHAIAFAILDPDPRLRCTTRPCSAVATHIRVWLDRPAAAYCEDCLARRVEIIRLLAELEARHLGRDVDVGRLVYLPIAMICNGGVEFPLSCRSCYLREAA